jgi:hypothetical protein
MPLSRRLRFEILRRDDHTCRYCGRRAPDVQLTVDHVNPMSLGGGDTPENLVTSCVECNSGKASISPDSPLLADVERDALRWRSAIDSAVQVWRLQRSVIDGLIGRFDDTWSGWTYQAADGERVTVPRQSDWPETIERFLSLGLDMDLLTYLIGVAMRKPDVQIANVWTFFCGCCWRRFDELQGHARDILNAEEAPR